MDYKCFENLSDTEMANLLKLLKWKARHNDCDLDYVQIS